VNQKGSGKFIHLGIGDRDFGFAKSMWSY